jgi:hypothetical protein
MNLDMKYIIIHPRKLWDFVIKHRMDKFITSSFSDSKRIDIQGKWWIELLNLHTIDSQDINAIYEIEQDMWARSLWEYIRCNYCSQISWKYDVYPAHIHTKIFLMKTVSEIERILWIHLCCPCCQSLNVEHIFPKSYWAIIAQRYSEWKSIVTAYRDNTGNLRWFMDAYIWSFELIFSREFLYYYWQGNQEKIREKMEDISWISQEEFFCITALWTDQSFWNMFIIYSLMRHMFHILVKQDPNITGIYESVLGTNTHWIYSATGWKRIFSHTFVSNKYKIRKKKWYICSSSNRRKIRNGIMK